MREDGQPKCVERRIYGFSDEGLSDAEIIDELKFDMTKPKLKNGELLSHWVVSLDEMGAVEDDELFEIAREFMGAMGYREEHKQVFALHKDTEHPHIHVAACKVDMWTGRILREGKGWYKNEGMKAIAEIAYRHGLDVAKENRFRICDDEAAASCLLTKTEGFSLRKRSRQEKRKGAKRLEKGLTKGEAYRQEASEQRKLREMLSGFVKAHEDDFGGWKFADFHGELAKLGIECQRKEIGNGRYGILFSLDSRTFCAASSVCPELTYTRILKKIGAKSWRDARDNVREVLEQARREGVTNTGGLGTLRVSVRAKQEIVVGGVFGNRRAKRSCLLTKTEGFSLRKKRSRRRTYEPAEYHYSRQLFWMHYQNIKRLNAGDNCVSRYEMILLAAKRLVATGHTRKEIKNIICSSLCRDGEEREIKSFAKKITDRAFREDDANIILIGKWMKLETELCQAYYRDMSEDKQNVMARAVPDAKADGSQSEGAKSRGAKDGKRGRVSGMVSVL